MHSFTRYRPSPSMVVALIALVTATGGTATALSGKNVVKKDDLAKNSVSARAIAKNAVSRSEIKKNGVSRSEIKNGAVKGDEVDESSLGQVPDAATVGGKSAAALTVGCPAGTIRHMGVCIEDTARAAGHWFEASETCGDAGRRLPLATELRSFRRTTGITLTGDEISANVYFDGGFRYFAVSDAGALVNTNTATDNAFRCVGSLSN